MNCTPGPFHIIGVRPPYTIHAKLPSGSDTDALATVHHEGNQQLFAAVHDLKEALTYAVELFDQIQSDETSLIAETDLSEKEKGNRERFYKFELLKSKGKVDDALSKARAALKKARGE